MSRDKQVTIDDRTYIITKYDALKALKIKGQLIAVLAPALGKAFESGAMNQHAGMSTEQIGMRLLQVLPSLDMDKATDMIVMLCESARYGDGDKQGSTVVFTEAFDDDLMPAYELAIEVCRFNFEKYVKALSQGTAHLPTLDNN